MKFKLPSDQSFGMTMAALLTAAAAYSWHSSYPETIWLVLAAAIILVSSLGAPILLRPLNVLWTGLGYALSRVVNPLVLGIIFFAVVTPIGLWLRVLRRDPLRLRRNPDAASYWIAREADSGSTDFTRQF
ncbi:MAG: hypothetical protein FIA97_10115 [Methylococcaceae bacterium]|nr:hypothetical protein [Methylococcaceae bacterium]